MNNLQLIKAERFGEIEADIYSNGQEMYMTSEQLGECLDYSNARESINKLVSRNAYLRNKEFSGEVKLTSSDGKAYNTRVFTEDGIYEVTMLSSQPKAKEFRAWIRKVLKALRRGDIKVSAKPMTALEMLHVQAQAMFEIEEKVNAIEDKLDNQMTIDHGQQRTLQGEIGKRVYERAAQVFPATEYKEHIKQFFAAIYHDIKNVFGVASYRDIRPIDYKAVIEYIGAWREPAKLRVQVERDN